MKRAMSRTSPSLLERLRVGADDRAWGQFVELYAPLIYHWLRECGLQHQDVCDVGQEVLLTVVREMPGFRYNPGRGSFRAWLRVVVKNRLRAFLRTRRNSAGRWENPELETRLHELADPASETALRWDEQHDSHVTAHVLALLKSEFEPTTWRAFWRVVVEGEKPTQVAVALHMSTNAVYLAKSRVLRRLRQESTDFLDWR